MPARAYTSMTVSATTASSTSCPIAQRRSGHGLLRAGQAEPADGHAAQAAERRDPDRAAHQPRPGPALSERLDDAINRYTNRALTTAEIIAELVKLAKQMRDAAQRHTQLGLSVAEAAL